MSTYIINTEPEATALANGDEFVIYQASSQRTKKVGAPAVRRFASSGVVNITTATATLSSAAHAGRTVTLNRAAGIAITLPAATGSGDVYRILVGTTFTGDATITCAGTDTLVGQALLGADGGDTVLHFQSAPGNKIITFTATNTTGGIAGAWVDLVDAVSGRWTVRIISDAAGTEATPFSGS
jgi:hypothetical protein